MKKVVLYTDEGIKSVEFEFNEPEVKYDNLNRWVSVNASNRTIILSIMINPLMHSVPWAII